jgi:hypothetical protein
MTCIRRICIVVGLIAAIGATAEANWLETFGGNALDHAWTWGCYPDVTTTFSHPIKDGAGDDDYLGLDETTPSDQFGSQFGMGFGAGDFADVRVGAVVNVTGDASRNYSGIAARANSFVDPDGSITGIAPGMVVTGAYTMFYHWEDGPLRVRIELMKVYMNGNDIHEGAGTFMPEVPVPGLDHERSHYVELEVVGSDPVYITGSIYEYKGGPLLVRTPTMVDTSGQDPWEDGSVPTAPGFPPAVAVFTGGKSGVFAVNENPSPAGYHVTFDTVSSVSEPSAVCLSPADGATDVDVDVDLSWVEAAFATSRELWFGKEGAMRKVNPGGTTYDPGTLEFGQTYQWRIDQIGPGGTTQGHVFAFTTEGTPDGCLLVDDFESYDGDWDIQVAWPDDIDGWNYTFLETFEVYSGAKAMRFEYQNQFEPYITKLVHTFAGPQDLTKGDLAVLSLHFRGLADNYEQKLFVELEDSRGPAYAVAVDNPFSYAAKTEMWQKWSIELSEFSGGGLDLTAVTKISIGTGDGTPSAQPIGPPADMDFLYIDDIKMCPPRCSLNSNADLDGSCRIDFGDFSAIANEWLNEGAYALP